MNIINADREVSNLSIAIDIANKDKKANTPGIDTNSKYR